MAEAIQLLRSRHELKRVKGGRDGLYPFFETLTWDVVHWFDDFLGDTTVGGATTDGMYETVTGTDGALAILANQENGVAELSAAVGAGGGDEYCGLSLPELAFTAVRNPVIAVRLNMDAITGMKVEVGFTDVTTDAGAVNVKNTPSFTAADFVGWVFDTDDNTRWEGMGVAGGTAATTVEAAISPTAGTFETMVVALREYDATNNYGAARFLRLNSDGRMTYDSGWQSFATGYITSTTTLVPWVFVQERNSEDRNVRIDFIDVRARRTED